MEVFAEFLARMGRSTGPERRRLAQAGYDYTKELVRIPLDSPLDLPLLEKMIEFNILEKAECSTFWRK